MIDNNTGIPQRSGRSVLLEPVDGFQHGLSDNTRWVTKVSSAQDREGNGTVVLLAGFSQTSGNTATQNLRAKKA